MTELPTKPPTRVALRIADGPGPAYLAAGIEALAHVDGAEIVLVLLCTPGRQPHSARERLLDGLDGAYDWMERRALRGGPAALASETRMPWPGGATVVRDATHPMHVDALGTAQVDVLIDLASDDRLPPLPVPRNGSWSLRYAVGIGGPRHPRLSRPRRSAGLAESLLRIELSDGLTFETEVGISGLRRVGFGRDRDAIYWRSSNLAARRLARLVTDTLPRPTDGVQGGSSANQTQHASSTPGRPPFVRLAATLVVKVLERMLFRTGWLVLVRRRAADQDPPPDLSGFEPIAAPAGRFYADPFVVAAHDGPRLYVEDCPDGTHRGRISSLRMTSDGRWAFERVVLDDLDHRAYPHVITTPNGLLLSPDSGRHGGVDLFLDEGSGLGLKHVGHGLHDVSASDPTVLWHAGTYWLFVNVTTHGMSPWDELHLYTAADLGDVWHPHPQNPIVADARRARPAGRIFLRGGTFVRPGQDCSESYGGRIVLSTITKLTLDEYEEHPIRSIEPEGVPGIQRTHTYNFDGSIETLDGYRRVRRGPGRSWMRR